MNERYTYGYNVGWNVENEYIYSLNDIMKNYNEQMAKIYGPKDEDYVVSDIPLVDADIIKNNTITEEQIRQWYNEDYTQNNRYVPYEKYKQDILEQIRIKNEKLNNEALEKVGPLHKGLIAGSDEYFANLYVLIKIKEYDSINK